MAVEAKRGCGFRKVGGIYLVADGFGLPCDRLPIELSICPTCSGGIKQARGWTWVNLAALAGGQHETFFGECRDLGGADACAVCSGKVERAGLLWIGERFYSSVGAFEAEVAKMGISRRISAVPRDFKVGETWVLIAHPEVRTKMVANVRSGIWGEQKTPGIFRVFLPQRIETLITETQSRDAEYMAGLEKKGMTAIVVPDGDKDHQGTVYDAEEGEPELDLVAGETRG